MKKLTIIALFAAIGLVSCKDTKAEIRTGTVSTETTPITETGTTEATAVDPHAGHNHGPEGNDHGAATTAEGMNPPHGQPGHRCDIAVGAPLNSAPAQPTASTPANSAGQGFLGSGNAQAPQQATPQQAAPTQQTAPGMQGKPNPAHGQPGHRCDVSVGQPLP
ncbi:MAG TPA: hypothetical protein VLY87_05785 [Flavobacterium sp.]|nr:hypothetical protein [Flavobacterium sp.]